MRVSLNKTALIEKLLCCPDALQSEEKALAEAYTILDTDFASEIALQKKAVDLILEAGRRELRQEINEVHDELFCPHAKNTLKNRILKLFL